MARTRPRTARSLRWLILAAATTLIFDAVLAQPAAQADPGEPYTPPAPTAPADAHKNDAPPAQAAQQEPSSPPPPPPPPPPTPPPASSPPPPPPPAPSPPPPSPPPPRAAPKAATPPHANPSPPPPAKPSPPPPAPTSPVRPPKSAPVSAAPTSSFARPIITALRDGKGIAKLKASVDKVVNKIQPALVPIKAKLKRLENQPLKDWQIYVAAGGITVLDVCVVSFLRITSGELLVERFPILTNAMQGALLVLSGDLVAQMALRSARGVKEARLDTTRLAKAAAVGVVNVGLWPYYWYWLIDSLLPSQAPADLWYPAWLLEWSLLAFKIGLDSLINGSVSILSSFSLWSLLDGDSVESLRSKLQKKFRETWLMDWKVWPLYNLLCFSMIPLSLRPLSSGFASTAWNAFISHQSQRVA